MPSWLKIEWFTKDHTTPLLCIVELTIWKITLHFGLSKSF